MAGGDAHVVHCLPASSLLSLVRGIDHSSSCLFIWGSLVEGETRGLIPLSQPFPLLELPVGLSICLFCIHSLLPLFPLPLPL